MEKDVSPTDLLRAGSGPRSALWLWSMLDVTRIRWLSTNE